MRRIVRFRHFIAAMTHKLFRQIERGFPLAGLLETLPDKACLALRHSEESVTDIALEVGFYDSSHFVRQFRRFVGMTPTDYRERFFD